MTKDKGVTSKTRSWLKSGMEPESDPFTGSSFLLYSNSRGKGFREERDFKIKSETTKVSENYRNFNPDHIK